MLNRNGREMTAEELNDDGVVFLICTIFGLYDGYDRCDSHLYDESTFDDVLSRKFGGECQKGNSHNGAYQLGLNMSRIAMKKYTGKLTL